MIIFLDRVDSVEEKSVEHWKSVFSVKGGKNGFFGVRVKTYICFKSCDGYYVDLSSGQHMALCTSKKRFTECVEMMINNPINLQECE